VWKLFLISWNQDVAIGRGLSTALANVRSSVNIYRVFFIVPLWTSLRVFGRSARTHRLRPVYGQLVHEQWGIFGDRCPRRDVRPEEQPEILQKMYESTSSDGCLS
jgi:hypothetical protein